MEDPWGPLLLAAALGLGLRAGGLVLAGALRPDHPFVAWAGAVSQATLAAYVAGALLAPAAASGPAPVWARLAALAAALAVLALGRGRLGAAMAAGLLALAALRALAG